MSTKASANTPHATHEMLGAHPRRFIAAIIAPRSSTLVGPDEPEPAESSDEVAVDFNQEP